MATITAARDALADAAREALDVPRGLGFWLNPTPESVYVIPRIGAPYQTFENGTFCKPLYSLSVVLIGPSSNPANSSEWLDERLARAPSIASDDRTLGGLVSAVVVEDIGQPGWVNIEAGPLVLSVEIRLAPLFVAS